jgi:hypothetical protein
MWRVGPEVRGRNHLSVFWCWIDKVAQCIPSLLICSFLGGAEFCFPLEHRGRKWGNDWSILCGRATSIRVSWNIDNRVHQARGPRFLEVDALRYGRIS